MSSVYWKDPRKEPPPPDEWVLVYMGENSTWSYDIALYTPGSGWQTQFGTTLRTPETWCHIPKGWVRSYDHD